MGHLMDALGKLRNIFKLIAILIIVALVIAIAVMVYIVAFRPEGLEPDRAGAAGGVSAGSTRIR